MTVEPGLHELTTREQTIFKQIEDGRRGGRTTEEAARNLKMLVTDDEVRDEIDRVCEYILQLGRRNQLLKIPGGMESLAYRATADEARMHRWYTGPQPHDSVWPGYREVLLDGGLPPTAIMELDEATTKIVAYLAPPTIFGVSKKGLVLGHVQSGKTANFAGVIAKAADAGYRLFIVLSGIHNALRQQTQRRLDQQLVEPTRNIWHPLTDSSRDFGNSAHGDAILHARDIRSLAVVKKNPARLARLVSWLESIPAETREQCPALIIDDESDQASPNTAREDWDRTTINKRIVELRRLLPTSTYVAYTATPFANIFIDPTDDEDLYPDDFIINLPRPAAYFGAESLFGRAQLDQDEEPDDGYDMIRLIPGDEAQSLRAPKSRADRDTFQPAVTRSLGTAIRWYLLATAARVARGHEDFHSSMLIHTTQYSQVHLNHRRCIDTFVRDIARSIQEGDRSTVRTFKNIWDEEHARVVLPELGERAVSWAEVSGALKAIASRVEVVADNYLSDDRLTYTEHDHGRFVIAVGGNTLSRGLTLEGLVVSYFVRSASAYDTLLQMGRWFGYRKGYAEFPRVWLTQELADAFRHLATVEAEIRLEIERYQDEAVTPQSYAVRVRTHPALLITSKLKQKHVEKVRASYAGRRLQTFVFAHRDPEIVRGNQQATRKLVNEARSRGAAPESKGSGRTLLRGVDVETIITFLQEYRFHESHLDLRTELLTNYIRRRVTAAAELREWSVGILGRGDGTRRVDGRIVDLGQTHLGLEQPVPLINRAPLKGTGGTDANIKSLMSKPIVYSISRSPARMRGACLSTPS